MQITILGSTGQVGKAVVIEALKSGYQVKVLVRSPDKLGDLKEKVEAAISTEYQQLLTALQKSEENQLNQNQKEIKNLILDEIIKRYQYKEGLYQYYLKNNSEIKKAVSILNDTPQYNKILKL